LRVGLRLGRDCVANCAGVTAIIVVTGGMDLTVMALATAAITLERLAPDRWRVRPALGMAAVAAAGWLMVQGI
jgi:predicted metal-binding membrane protein